MTDCIVICVYHHYQHERQTCKEQSNLGKTMNYLSLCKSLPAYLVHATFTSQVATNKPLGVIQFLTDTRYKRCSKRSGRSLKMTWLVLVTAGFRVAYHQRSLTRRDQGIEFIVGI